METEKFSLIIDVSGEKISITSDKDLELIATNGKCVIDVKELEIKSGGAVQLEASGDVTLKGSKVEVEASGDLALKGSKVEAEASGQMVLKGSAIDMN